MNFRILILLSALTLSATAAESPGEEAVDAKFVGDWIGDMNPAMLTIMADGTFLFHAWGHPPIGGTLEKADSSLLAQVITDGKPYHKAFPITIYDERDMLIARSQLPKYHTEFSPTFEKAAVQDELQEHPLFTSSYQFVRMGKPLREEQIIGSWEEIYRASDKEGYWATQSSDNEISFHWLVTYNKDHTGSQYRIIMHEESKTYYIIIDEFFIWEIVGDTIVQKWKHGPNTASISPFRTEIEKDIMRFNLSASFRISDMKSKRLAIRKPDSTPPTPPEGFRKLDKKAFDETLKSKAKNKPDSD